MNSNKYSASGLAGKALIVTGDASDEAIFVATPETQIIPLDPNKRYNIFVTQAAATDYLTYVTQDVLNKVLDGTAAFGAVTTQANVAADGFLGATPVGATGIKITATKHAGANDDAGIVTSLGGRVKVRAVPATSVPDSNDVFPGGYAPAVAFA